MNTSSSNGALAPRRWQPRPALRDDLEVPPSLFDEPPAKPTRQDRSTWRLGPCGSPTLRVSECAGFLCFANTSKAATA